MPDLTSTLRKRLRAEKALNLDLGPQTVQPAYGGLSLLNLPASLAHWLGAPDFPHPPLDLPDLDAMMDGVRQIVVILVDALSLDRFLHWSDVLNPELAIHKPEVLSATLTSVVPSTTSSALTTLWTGRSPAEHAVVGYELFLKEYGLVANMIKHAPMALDQNAGLLGQAGFDPKTALPVATLGPHWAAAGVEVHAMIPETIRDSGLSRMHYQDVACHSYDALSDLWDQARELAERPLRAKRLLWIYFSNVDWLSHHFGPDSENTRQEFEVFLRTWKERFVLPLLRASQRQTVCLMLSDHGQRNTPVDKRYEICRHDALASSLHMLPTGENRLAYLYVKPGHVEQVRQYFERTWPAGFELVASTDALEAGLFGPGTPAPQTLDRLGDLIAIGRGGAYLWWAAKENAMLGRHGGVSEEEMLVPLLAVRLA